MVPLASGMVLWPSGMLLDFFCYALFTISKGQAERLFSPHPVLYLYIIEHFLQ